MFITIKLSYNITILQQYKKSSQFQISQRNQFERIINYLYKTNNKIRAINNFYASYA